MSAIEIDGHSIAVLFSEDEIARHHAGSLGADGRVRPLDRALPGGSPAAGAGVPFGRAHLPQAFSVLRSRA